MKKFLLPVFFLLTAFYSFGQTDSLLKWHFSIKRIADSVYELKAKTTIPADWHVYGTTHAVDVLQETVIVNYDYENAKNLQPISFTGTVQQIADPTFENKQVNIYKGDVEIKQRFAISGTIPAELKGKITAFIGKQII